MDKLSKNNKLTIDVTETEQSPASAAAARALRQVTRADVAILEPALSQEGEKWCRALREGETYKS